jgi:hypothetical protein
VVSAAAVSAAAAPAATGDARAPNSVSSAIFQKRVSS